MKHAMTAAGVLFVGVLFVSGCHDPWGEFGWFGPSEEQWVKMANDPTDPDKRRQGIGGLARLGWGGADRHAGLYVEKLTDEDNGVRSAAVRALGKLRQEKYLPPLVAMLEDRSAVVRDDAADVLDGITGEPAVSALQVHATSDPAPLVRARCAHALHNYPAKDVMNTLVACLKDDQSGVRYAAHDSLVSMTGRDYGEEVGKWSDYVAGRAKDQPGAKAHQRPWWDWLGVTDPTPPAKPAEPKGVEAQPAAPPPYQRPWWDWLGVTVPKDKPAPASQPASQPATAPVGPNP